jgi:hypothetical protein
VCTDTESLVELVLKSASVISLTERLVAKRPSTATSPDDCESDGVRTRFVREWPLSMREICVLFLQNYFTVIQGPEAVFASSA